MDETRFDRVIRKKLKSRNDQLSARAEQLISQAKQLLPHSLSTLPSFTDHGPDHTHTVERIAGMCLPNELMKELTEYELFFLLLAFHYHDLGLVGTELQNKSPQGQDQVRHEHAISIGERIVQEWNKLGFQDENEAKILAEVCRGHRPIRDDDGIANWDEIAESTIVSPGNSVRLRLLSALIYALDELHIGADRAGQRVEEFKEIGDEEAKRHWRRHRAIRGPDRQGDKIAFCVTPATSSFEEDIRRNVLKKAFFAVRDLQQQISSEGLNCVLPTLSIQWEREAFWKLLVIELLNEEEAIDESSLIDNCVALANDHKSSLTDLSDLCDEIGSEESDFQNGIARAVRDLKRLAILTSKDDDSDKLVLSTDSSAASRILQLLAEADELDRLFKSIYAANHEFAFFRKGYGERYFQDNVAPLIESGFGIDFSAEPDHSPFIRIIKASPTACRMVAEMRPSPSVLVRRGLLTLTALAGCFRDIWQDPELLLEKDVRQAVREAAEMMSESLTKTVKFGEELALVSGLTQDEINGVLAKSSDWAKEFAPQSTSDDWPRFRVSQKLPETQPQETTSFPYLMLAGIRAGEMVQLRCNKGSQLELKEEESTAEKITTDEPVYLAVGPGVPHQLPKVDWRCNVEVDRDAKAIRFHGFPLHDQQDKVLPISLRIPSPKYAEPSDSQLQMYFVHPELTVGHLVRFRAASELVEDEETEIQLLIGTARTLFATMQANAGAMSGFNIGFDSTLVGILHDIDADLSAPWFIANEHVEKLVKADSSATSDAFAEITEELKSNKPEITTVSLSLEFEPNRPYQQDFLGFYPEMTFNPPKIAPGGKCTQAELEDLWDRRRGAICLETRLREDHIEIANSFRDWARDTTKEFPITIDSELPPVHHCKTVATIVFEPRIDRFWYTQVPTRIRLRPTTQEEQYRIEIDYWRAKNDDRRAELMEERLAQLLSAQEGQNNIEAEQPPTSDSSKEDTDSGE